jgi:predicted RNA-binding Zn-ribbon protein involved in translation (DUF1610 family)
LKVNGSTVKKIYKTIMKKDMKSVWKKVKTMTTTGSMNANSESWLEFFYCPKCGGQNMGERRSDGNLYLIYSDCDLCGERI